MVDLASESLSGQAWGDLLFGARAYRGTPEELANVLRAYAGAGFSEVQVWLNPCSIAGLDAFAPVLALLDEQPTEGAGTPSGTRLGEASHA
jgi:hypothetical protein